MNFKETLGIIVGAPLMLAGMFGLPFTLLLKDQAAEKEIMSCLTHKNISHSSHIFSGHQWGERVLAVKANGSDYLVSNFAQVSKYSNGKELMIGGFFPTAIEGQTQWQGPDSLQPIAEMVRVCFNAKPAVPSPVGS